MISENQEHTHEHTKLEPCARLCCFLGYGIEQKVYRCRDPIFQRIRTSRHVVFWEHKMFSSLSNFVSILSTSTPLFTNPDVDYFYSDTYAGSSTELSSPSIVPSTSNDDVPTIDHEETIAPVARITSVRTLLAIAASRQWALTQMDVKNAFMNGELLEEVYMHPPLGYTCQENKVCRLRKALYGLKQAPRAWFAKFHSIISQLGFSSSPHDSALFTRKTENGTVVLLLHVDDMIITDNDSIGIVKLKQFLFQHFEMNDLGPLSYF